MLDALRDELTTEHTVAQAAEVVNRIGTRMKARGVKRLALGPRTASGAMKVLLETNPTDSIAELRPSGAVPKGRSVRANIELLLRPARPRSITPTDTKLAARLGTGEPALQAKGKDPQTFFQVGSAHEQAGTRSGAGCAIGGVVLVPDKDRVHLVTWNTSSQALHTFGNETHAERQFDHWVRGVKGTEFGDAFLGRVYSVNMHLRDYSPCGTCIDMLRATRRLSPAIESANLYWYEFYPGWASPTSWPGLRSLASAGWHLHAPGTAMPPEENMSEVRVTLVDRPR